MFICNTAADYLMIFFVICFICFVLLTKENVLSRSQRSVRCWVGVPGAASYLLDRCHCVSINNVCSRRVRSLMLPRGHVVSFHCNADDTQSYVPVRATDPVVHVMFPCDVKYWQSQNFLQLDSSKTVNRFP